MRRGAHDMNSNRVHVSVKILVEELAVICFLPMAALKAFAIHLAHMVNQPCVHQFISYSGSQTQQAGFQYVFDCGSKPHVNQTETT